MYIEIHLNADELTDQDRAILTAIGNAGASFGVTRETAAEEAKPETPKKRAPRKPKVVEQPTEEALDEAVEAAIEKHNEEIEKPSEPEEEEKGETPTLDEVANVATAFIRNGKRDEVAKILNEDLGVEKVTALKDSPEKVPELFDRLVDLYNVQNPASRKAVRQQITEDAAPLFLARTEA